MGHPLVDLTLGVHALRQLRSWSESLASAAGSNTLASKGLPDLACWYQKQ
jgi:hypothetical protein